MDSWGYTLPETNISPEHRPGPKRKGSSSNHQFSGAIAVRNSGSVTTVGGDISPTGFWAQFLFFGEFLSFQDLGRVSREDLWQQILRTMYPLQN